MEPITPLAEAVKDPNDPSSRVIVSHESFEREDPEYIIDSNVSFVNHLRRRLVTIEEIPLEAVKSYYVDFYYEEINNGGFSQFAYNSRMSQENLQLVKTGLSAVGAWKNLSLLTEFENFFESLPAENKENFLKGEYFGDNQARDCLDSFSKLIDSGTENMFQLNAIWLRSLPNLIALSIEEMKIEAERRVSLIPEKEMRRREQLGS